MRGHKVYVSCPLAAGAVSMRGVGHADGLKGIWRSPDRGAMILAAASRAVVLPTDPSAIEQGCQRGVTQTVCDPGCVVDDDVPLFPGGVDRVEKVSILSVAACLAVEIFRDEDAHRVVFVAHCGSSGKDKLVCRKARTLIGLKHEVRPAVLLDHREVRSEDSVRVFGARTI